jgi:hypothetical protein
VDVLEVCKWFDPATQFPCQVNRVAAPEESRANRFNVLILNRELRQTDECRA